MKRFLIALYFLASLSASSVFGADPRYTLTEYSMDGCGACIEAEKDVAEIKSAGIEVRRFNTSVDPIGDAEARRYKLHLRPAWRLARADGYEVGRWYGAGTAGIIVATIRAKFPTPDNNEPIATPLASPETEGVDAIQEQTTEPELAPSALAELDALKTDEGSDDENIVLSLRQTNGEAVVDKIIVLPKNKQNEELKAELDSLTQIERMQIGEEVKDDFLALKNDPNLAAGAIQEALRERREKIASNESVDFRDRKPVSEPFLDSSFLDRSLDEWENRDEEEEEEEEPRRFSEPGESDARLGNRIAEKAAAAILDGLDPKINAIKREALTKFESIGEKATKRLEDRVGQEFQSAKDGLTARFNDAIGDVRSDVLKGLSEQINDAVKHLFFNVLTIALVCFGVWLAIRVIKKEGAKR